MLMSPHEKVGEGEFRTLGRVLTKKAIKDMFISKLYIFEVMKRHDTPGDIDD